MAKGSGSAHVPTDDSTLSLAELMHTLGTPLMRSLTDSNRLARPTGGPAFYDRLDELPGSAGGILLLPGIDASSPVAVDAITAASAHGYSAVVVKLRDASPQRAIAAADDGAVALLAVADDASWSHLADLITSVMRNRSIASSLSEPNGGDLFTLANAIAAAAGGAVAIEDIEQNVLAYSNLDQPIDSLRRDGILARQVPDLAKHKEQYRTVMLTPGVVRFERDPSDGEAARIAAAVRAGKEELGSIWIIDANDNFGTDAEHALLDATRLAAIHLLQARNSLNLERQIRREWLRSVFEGAAVFGRTAALAGVVADLPSIVVGFAFVSDDSGTQPLPSMLLSVIERYCAVFQANITGVSLGAVTYILIPAVHDSSLATRIAAGAASAVLAQLGEPVLVGISSPRTGTDLIAGLRREADEVLSVLSEVSGMPELAHATDVRPQLLLLHLARELDANPRLRHPGVAALLDHDDRKGTEYRESLTAYFDEGGNIGKASARLTVHPNTLRYRLKHADELFALNLDEPDERLTIWLQLRLAQAR